MPTPQIRRWLFTCLIFTVGVPALSSPAASQPAEQNELAALVRDVPETRDEYGISAAMSGEYAVVGAPISQNYGRAYVFMRGENDTWTEVQQLRPSELAFFSNFGASVDIDGDRMLVGAPDDDGADANFYTGAVYVFERQGDGSWAQTARIIASDATPDDEFGSSVALDGTRALIGAQQDGDSGDRSGSVYVFDRDSNGSWMESAKLTASDGGEEDYFGWAVDVSGDYAVVGAPSNGGTGGAYVFERQENGTWVEAEQFVPSDFGFVEGLGSGVAVDGSRALIGAPGTVETGVGEIGTAYILEREAGGTWTEVQRLTASDGLSFDYFGEAVDLSGDVAVIGAWGDAVSGVETGSAYVFERSTSGEWNESAKFVPSESQSTRSLGYSVSISGDRALIGASDGFPTGPNSGSALLFALDATQSTNAHEMAERPSRVTLHGNYPNPFNPSTRIEFDLAVPSQVHLAVYDMLGREVEVLVSGWHLSGTHSVLFESGNHPGGTYMYRIESGSGLQTGTMVLMK